MLASGQGIMKEAVLFWKKRTKKLLLSCARTDRSRHVNQQSKVFWFFFSKKNCFLLLLACGIVIGCTRLPYAYINTPGWLLRCDGAVATLASAIVVALARTARATSLPARWLAPATFLATLAVQFLSTAWWPNSGDEYGYLFLADTLLHGRLYNPPAPVPDLFGFNWIFTVDGKRFSQYPPGFSALLVPFLALGVPFLLNPLLACALAWLFLDTLAALGAARPAAASFTAMLALSPFVLFNGASLFPHLLTAVAVIAIVRLHLAWQTHPHARQKLATGALFGLLLLTRYEVFAITATLYASSRIIALRRRAARELALVAAGGLPLAACFMAYNAIITGKPLRTPFAWASPGGGFGFHAVGDSGMNTPVAALARNAQWTGELIVYTSAALLALWAVALFAKIRARRLQYFDCIFPAAIAFFVLFASYGGHRFGPRYWFFAWPTAMLTIATGLTYDRDWLHLPRLRLHLPTLAALHLPLYAGTALTIAFFNSQYVAARRAVYAATPPLTPAIILIPTRMLPVSRFETSPIRAGSADFARNDLDFTNPVLYGRADDGGTRQALYIARACTLGRHVYVWQPSGTLTEIACGR
jgi:hypothetical protein